MFLNLNATTYLIALQLFSFEDSNSAFLIAPVTYRRDSPCEEK
jgi:hypothetical protein